MKKLLLLIFGAGLLVASLPGMAEAALIKYYFRGELSYISDTAGLLGIQYSLGDTFSGSLSYESSLPDGSPDPNYFTTSDSSIVSSVMLYGHTFDGSVSGSIDINGSLDVMMQLNGYTSTPYIDLGSNPGRLIKISYWGDGTTFDQFLPTTLNLDDFTNATVEIHGDTGPGGPYFSLLGTITSLSLNPIPEPPPALVGYWNFDEDSEDTAYDSSAYGNDGAIEGATPAVGKCGNAALSFDAGLVGGVDYVVVPNSDSINTSTFTVSFWVSLSDLDETMVFLHKRNVRWGRNFQISYNTVGPNGEPKDYLKVKIDNGATSNDFDNAAYAEVNLENDKYYYVAATYNQSYLRLFLGESPVAQIAEFPIDMTDNVGDGDLYIGAHSADYPDMNPTNGIIDEVRIYNYALTQEQIQADMEACLPPNNPPVADAGPDQTLECAGATGALVTLDGSNSSDPDSTPGTNDDIVSFQWFNGGTPIGTGETLNYTFPLGVHTVTLVVTDSFDETASDEVIITVEDSTPPEISVSVSPDTLWPPNHKMVLCTPTLIVSDNCDSSPTVNLVSVSSNESDEAYAYDPAFDMYTSEGHTDGDIQIVNDDIYLRAERSGEGDGRIYTITYEAADASGNPASASATVTVPHNQ